MQRLPWAFLPCLAAAALAPVSADQGPKPGSSQKSCQSSPSAFQPHGTSLVQGSFATRRAAAVRDDDEKPLTLLHRGSPAVASGTAGSHLANTAEDAAASLKTFQSKAAPETLSQPSALGTAAPSPSSTEPPLPAGPLPPRPAPWAAPPPKLLSSAPQEPWGNGEAEPGKGRRRSALLGRLPRFLHAKLQARLRALHGISAGAVASCFAAMLGICLAVAFCFLKGKGRQVGRISSAPPLHPRVGEGGLGMGGSERPHDAAAAASGSRKDHHSAVSFPGPSPPRVPHQDAHQDGIFILEHAAADLKGADDPMAVCLASALFVPEGCETTLLVPRVFPAHGRGMVVVEDAKNKPVFRITFNCPNAKSGAKDNCMVLSSPSAEEIYAFARLHTMESGKHSMTFLTHSEVPVASLEGDVKKNPVFRVTPIQGRALEFHGDLNGGSGEMLDEDQNTVAISDPAAGIRRSVRIGPFTDAGLVALSMCAMDILDFLNHKPAVSRPSRQEHQ